MPTTLYICEPLIPKEQQQQQQMDVKEWDTDTWNELSCCFRELASLR